MIDKKWVKPENYFTIQGWMITTLDLKGVELLVFAIIYRWSAAENHKFTGSLQFLADWTNSTKTSVQTSLKKLTDKKLVLKVEYEKNGLRFCEYSINAEELEKNLYGTQKICIPEKKLVQNRTKNLYTIKETCTKNRVLKKNKNKVIKKRVLGNFSNPTNQHTNKKEKFKKPITKEILSFCLEKGYQIDAEAFFDYYESKGWMIGKNKMKDWKAAVRNWVRNNKKWEEEKLNNKTANNYGTRDDLKRRRK